jgi:hypothetical protein
VVHSHLWVNSGPAPLLRAILSEHQDCRGILGFA